MMPVTEEDDSQHDCSYDIIFLNISIVNELFVNS